MRVSDLTIGCFDLGLWTENCLRLSRDAKKVYYHRPNYSAFPEPFARKTGLFEGLDISKDFFDDLSKDKYDMVFVPDIGCKGVVNLCRKIGVPTVGVGDAEAIETDRWGTREYQETVLPWQYSEEVIGCKALEKFIKENSDKEWYIKVPNEYRGVEESFKVLDPKDAQSSINHLRHEVGPFADEIKFMAEECLKGPEPGMDFLTRKGRLVLPTQVGYEKKGAGIIMRTYRQESDIPKPIKAVYDAYAPEFEKYGLDFFSSFETIMSNEDGTKAGPYPFPLDWTLRLAGPGTAAIQSELIDNYTEVMAALAFGEDIEPVFSHKYAAACAMHSEEAMKTWLNVSFPKELRRWVKMRIGCQKNNDFYAIPKFDSICTVVGFGDTIAESIDLVKERMKEVRGKRLDGDIHLIDGLKKDIEEGRECGINF